MADPLPAARAQDAAIAEALGATWSGELLRLPSRGPSPGDEEPATGWIGSPIARRNKDGLDVWPVCPAYSADPVAFEALLAEIGKRGLGPQFASTLRGMQPHGYAGEQFDYYDVWELFLSAPQSTKAAACLAVLKEAKTNG